MSYFKVWGWDKKLRTMLRFVKPGDIFCFKLDGDRYCFGRIISKIITGHVAELFDYMSAAPEITEKKINEVKRIYSPIVIDTYGLFDKKVYKDGGWRVIGHQSNFSPIDVENVYFTYGLESSCKRVDVFGNEISISKEESLKYPKLSPYGDFDIKKLLNNI
ncbi:phosphotriesterase [Salmonella enterica subsp. enterica serovar Tanger]|nr:phosphotriesterase [Salmonella enterica subsp. enterica serovar Tanger]EBV4602354.1 phosphotriesterase [Salmonella enterica subsp. enterica serovar Tanger]